MSNTERSPSAAGPIVSTGATHSPADAGRPEMVRVRMTVDLVGPLAEELEKTAQQLGKSKTDVIREGLGYVFHALKARDDGYFVGAWKEEPDGKISRSREFVLGNK